MYAHRDLQSVYLRHQHVGEDDVWNGHSRHAETVPPIARLPHDVPFRFQNFPQEESDLWIVVNDKYGCNKTTSLAACTLPGTV